METKQSNVEQEQPEKDSQVDDQDQALESEENEEETDDTEQPEKDSEEDDSDSEDSEGSEETVTIDGQEYTMDELKAGLMRQSDYTKSKQGLAEQTRELARLIEEMKGSKPTKGKDVPPEVQKAIDVLKEHGAVFNDDIDKRFQVLQAQQDDARQFADVLSKNPELKGHAEFIKAYGMQNPKLSWADIFAKYSKTVGIVNKKKLEKAKLKEEPKGSKNLKSKDKKDELTEIERKHNESLPRGFRPKS